MMYIMLNKLKTNVEKRKQDKRRREQEHIKVYVVWLDNLCPWCKTLAATLLL